MWENMSSVIITHQVVEVYDLSVETVCVFVIWVQLSQDYRGMSSFTVSLIIKDKKGLSCMRQIHNGTVDEYSLFGSNYSNTHFT